MLLLFDDGAILLMSIKGMILPLFLSSHTQKRRAFFIAFVFKGSTTAYFAINVCY